MIRQLFPCNVEENTQQQDVDVDSASPSLQQAASEYQDTRYDPYRSEQIALSVLDLSQRLTENIVSQSSKKYEIISPISIASALQLTLLGAHSMTFNELMDL